MSGAAGDGHTKHTYKHTNSSRTDVWFMWGSLTTSLSEPHINHTYWTMHVVVVSLITASSSTSLICEGSLGRRVHTAVRLVGTLTAGP